MSVLFHDAFLDHALEIFWSEKCAVLLNWQVVTKSTTQYHLLNRQIIATLQSSDESDFQSPNQHFAWNNRGVSS